MAIIRFSALRDRLFAPRSTGAFVESPYNPDTSAGLVGAFASDGGSSTDVAITLMEHLKAFIPEAALAPDFTDSNSPVVVLVHGFQFAPDAPTPKPPKSIAGSENPHDTVFSYNDFTRRQGEDFHAVSWPGALSIPKSAGSTNGGVAIAFGWDSVPATGLKIVSDYISAYNRGVDSAGPLLAVLRQTAALVPGKPIDIFCHSLGTRPVLRTLFQLAATAEVELLKRVGRVVMLGGAELVNRAAETCDAIDEVFADFTDHGPQFFNIGNSFDNVLGWMQTAVSNDHNAIGRTGRDKLPKSPRWIDLNIGYASVRNWINQNFGIEVVNEIGKNNHWFYFTDTPNFALYRSILQRLPGWTVAELRNADPPIPRGLGHDPLSRP